MRKKLHLNSNTQQHSGRNLLHIYWCGLTQITDHALHRKACFATSASPVDKSWGEGSASAWEKPATAAAASPPPCYPITPHPHTPSLPCWLIEDSTWMTFTNYQAQSAWSPDPWASAQHPERLAGVLSYNYCKSSESSPLTPTPNTRRCTHT